jgi:hypothetical protein
MRVYNYARLPHWTLDRTTREADHIFHAVGIDTVWLECPVSEADSEKFQACHPSLGPTDVVLKIVPRSPSKREGFRDTQFGFAAGSQILIVYRQIEEMAKDSESSRPRILGLAIAHEVGHVLLGPNSHSPTGIMRAQWNPKDFERFSEGFRFTPEQVEKLRAELVLRIQHACQP